MGITVTDRAARHIERFLSKESGVGLRFGVKTVGCSGLSYTFECAREAKNDDVCFSSSGVNVVVNKADLLFIDGSILDFERKGLNEVFKVTNPKAMATCGCGESFTVENTERLGEQK